MNFDNKDMSKYFTIIAVLIMAALVVFLLRPVFVPIIVGLILAYICLPLYRRLLKIVRSKNLSASIIILILIVIIVVPIWFSLPMIIKQAGEIYSSLQSLNYGNIIRAIIPSASEATLVKVTASIQSAVTSIAQKSIGADSPINIFFQLPTMLINLFIVGFVFYFTLRDSDKLIELAKEISPFSKSKSDLFVQQFKGITDSIVYGHIITGIIQGLLAGFGMYIFGVHNVLILTTIAILMSIIPVLGPYIVYLPVAIFMFASGNTSLGLWYLVYNFTVVSTLDNVLRAYIVSKKTDMSSAIVFVGMMAGLFVYGVIGLLIGPLILAFFLIVLQLYKDKALESLFIKEDEHPTPRPSKSDSK